LALLEAAGLEARYGRAQVLFGIGLHVDAGEVAVLLGRNGAGKSTTLKALMGIVPATAGEVRYGGRRIDHLQPFEIARLGVGYVPEDRRIFSDLTVEENLEVGRRPAPDRSSGWTLKNLYELFPALAAMRTRRGGRMSGGEQQMLSIARTLAGNPALILLDEPSEGLAPIVVEELVRVLAQFKREGIGVLLCEQNLPFARRVADRAYVVEKGSIVYSGSLAALEANPQLREEYLAA
jgi:branched-chain amino acid transport system ATP-binding protein